MHSFRRLNTTMGVSLRLTDAALLPLAECSHLRWAQSSGASRPVSDSRVYRRADLIYILSQIIRRTVDEFATLMPERRSPRLQRELTASFGAARRLPLRRRRDCKMLGDAC